MRFDRSTGRYLGTITRAGGGPGEVGSPVFLHTLPGDSLFLYDQTYRRFGVYAPRNYGYIRGGMLAGRFPTAVTPVAGRIVVAASVVPGYGVGEPLHLHDAGGDWMRSFGSADARLNWDPSRRDLRLVAPDQQGGVWTVSQYGETVIERFSLDGRRNLRIRYSADAEPRGGPPGPKAQRYAMLQPDGQTLWVVTLVPDPDWRRGSHVPPTPDLVHGTDAVVIKSRPRLWDSLIDVIDVGSGRILARARLDEWVTHVFPGGGLLIHDERPDGTPVTALEALRFIPQQPRRR